MRGWWGRARAFLGASLLRQFMAVTLAGLGLASLAFLLILLSAQTRFLLSEHARASLTVNNALRAALENAMLKRDLPGLRRIVAGVGALPEVVGVHIIAPNGEIRFSSNDAALGTRLETEAVRTALRRGEARSEFLSLPGRGDVLRSINPVHNQPPCAECHGPPERHPVNGYLVVDFDAGPARSYALRASLMLIGMGAVVMALLAAALWWSTRRLVTARLQRLEEAARELGAGRLERRAPVEGADELARFARSFNLMAERLERARDQLAAALSATRSVLEAAPDGIRVIGPDYRIRDANAAHLAQLGLPREQVIGRPCYALTHGRDEPCPATLQTCPVARLREGRLDTTRFLDRLRLPGGREMSADIIAAPLRLVTDGGSEACAIEVIRDLDAEVELSQQQRLSEVAMLANGVAHEINTPLSSILLAVDQMRDALPEGDERRELAEVVEGEIRSCLEVTESLMRLSMPSEQTVTVFDLAELARDMLRLMAPALEQGGVEVHFEPPEGGAQMIGSESDMRILILNLVANAMHAMRGGGRLRLAIDAEPDSLRLTVADSGVGIAPEDLEHIFLPFWTRRADGSRGRGLGLALCRQVVRRAGGRIEVRSRPGEGATFTVTLPRQAPSAGAEAQHPPQEARP